MKQISVFVACVCLCAAAAVQAQSVAVVDMEELIKQHPSTASDKKLLDQTLKDFRAESDELRQKLEALQEDFEKLRKETQDPALSERARRTAEERATKARDALLAADRTAREKTQSRQEQLSDMQTRMLKKTIGELRESVAKYAEDRKIQIVLPAGQTVFNDKTLDITDGVLRQMNVPRPAPGRVDGAASAPARSPAPAVKDPAPAVKDSVPAVKDSAPAVK
ncbi:MAG: OmpH family outer membrane protein, partial [bacterium]